MLQRFGLLGDVHAEDVALEAALDHFERERVDAVLSVGDIVDGQGDLERCRALLERHRVAGVAGNHERWFLKNALRSLPFAHRAEACPAETRAFFAALPKVREFETPRGRLLLCHGVGEDDMIRLLPDDRGYALSSNYALEVLLAGDRYRFAVGGHTHRRMARRFGDFHFINPGTLARDQDPCFALLDVGAGWVQFFALGPSAEITPLERVGLSTER
jgi:predicted phosphodiesterase